MTRKVQTGDPRVRWLERCTLEQILNELKRRLECQSEQDFHALSATVAMPWQYTKKGLASALAVIRTSMQTR